MRAASSVTWLFVPADRPDRFEKARGAGADETILDLEDAVAAEAKPAARAHAVRWLDAGGVAWVRINGTGTPWHEDDVEALAGVRGLRGMIVPKAEGPEALARIAARCAGAGLVALVETARGVRNLDAICAAPKVERLAFGSIDLALDIDARDADGALRYARSELVIASRAAGLGAPIDGVTVEFRDLDLVARAAERAHGLGFGGKLCIHPAQVAPVRQAFAPSPAELSWARRVLDAAQAAPGGTFLVDGRMIDRPLLLRAQRLLARVERA